MRWAAAEVVSGGKQSFLVRGDLLYELLSEVTSSEGRLNESLGTEQTVSVDESLGTEQTVSEKKCSVPIVSETKCSVPIVSETKCSVPNVSETKCSVPIVSPYRLPNGSCYVGDTVPFLALN